MSWTESQGLILFIAVVLIVVSGLVLFPWIKKIPLNIKRWISVGLHFFLLLILIWCFRSLLLDQVHSRVWSKGWILPHGEHNSLGIGILEDLFGLAFGMLVCVVNIISTFIFSDEFFPVAALFSTAGLVLSWCSLSPWFCFLGLGSTMAGGFLSIAPFWTGEDEAPFVSRLFGEKTWAVLFSFIGFCALNAVQGSILWGTSSHAVNFSGLAVMGGWFVVVGLFFHCQSFPFIGSTAVKTELPISSRAGLIFIAPVLAHFALITRMFPELQELGIFPAAGWVALGLSFLSVISGLFRFQWKEIFSAWCSSALLLACPILAFAGPEASCEFLICFFVASQALSMIGASIGTGDAGNSHAKNLEKSYVQKQNTAKGATVLALLGSAGFIGWSSAGGLIHAFSAFSGEPTQLVLESAAVFFFLLLTWKLGWSLFEKNIRKEVSWALVLTPLFLSFLSLGLWWNGSFSGGVLQAAGDHPFSSIIEGTFESLESVSNDSHALGLAVYYGVWVLALALSFVLCGRKKDLWKKMSDMIPRTSHFIANGLGSDFVGKKIEKFVRIAGGATTRALDEILWTKNIPRLGQVSLSFAGNTVSRSSAWLEDFLNRSAKSSIEVPGKMLQMIQNGSIQWYLLFAIGSAVGILIHFLRI